MQNKASFPQVLLGILVFIVFRLLLASYRIRYTEGHSPKELEKNHPDGFIFAFWHEHLIPLALAFSRNKVCPMASRNFHGRVIGVAMKLFGFRMVYGSSNRGGKDKGGRAALRAFSDVLADGWCPAFAVDGSVGPRHKAKLGAVILARKSGKPIVPIAATYSNCWVLNTWDKMKIPKPFSKVDVYVGEPIYVEDGPEVDIEACNKSLEVTLHRSN